MATVPRTPDAELLVRLRARDREAWEELYALYQPRLRSFAFSLAGNAHDADDLVQETFVRAVPRLDHLDAETADVGAYLFTTLRNLFLKQVERAKRQQPVAEVPEPVLPTPIEDDPERGTLLRRQQDEVRLANSRLQPRQRLVLALRELEERSYAEIGELVGMKENAVAQLIFRARESLRVELRLAQVDPERLPETCRRYLPLLASHLDGQLKGPRLEETLAHLEGCERCQDALASMQEASRRYRSVFLPALLEADEARAEVEHRLELVGYWHGQARRRLARVTRRTAAIAAGALLLGGGSVALGVAVSREGAGRAALKPADSAPPSTAPAPETAPPTEAAGTTPPPTTAAPESPATTRPAPPRSTPQTTAASTATATAATTRGTTTAPTTPAPRPARPAPAPPVTQAPADGTAPTVRITQAPDPTVASDRVRVAFTSSEPGSTFSCRLDGSAYAACASPRELRGLAPGTHVFAVRAADRAGNVGKPATVSWTYVPPDVTPPTVAFSSTPAASTTETTASFAFAANEPGVAFQCSLDGAAYAVCSSPASFGPLAVGAHSLAVRGTDPAGNVGQPASFGWTVTAPPPPPPPPLPDLVVGAFARNAITVVNRGNAAAGTSILTITLVGTFTVPALGPGAAATFSWSTCRVGTYSAIVDRTNVVAESDETNNTATRSNSCR